jgi:Alcohol dehydrogenase GroES-like domain
MTRRSSRGSKWLGHRAPGDAIVQLTKTTICGTDLHILKGDVPSCSPGRILGHEGTGIICILKQRLRMRFLEIARADLRRRNVRRDREHRQAPAVAFVA